MNLAWKKKQSKYSNGYALYCGECEVGGYFWDACSSGDRNKPYRVYLLLPLPLSKVRLYKTEQEAKTAMENLIKEWFIKAGVKEEVCTL